MKINEVDKVTTLDSSEHILSIAKDGALVQIDNVNLAALLSNMNSDLSECILKREDDLNKITKSGVYYQSNTDLVRSLFNKPSGGVIGEMSMLVIGCGVNYAIQAYFNITSSLVFVRFKATNGWSVWRSINLT